MQLDEIILKIKQLISKIDEKIENNSSNMLRDEKSETIKEVLKTTDQLLEKVVNVLEDKKKD